MLKTIRDVLLVVAAFAVIAFVLDHFVELSRADSFRAGRLLNLEKQIEQMDKAYKAMVFDGDVKGIYQQIFRQNEVLMEYQKLQLRAAVANGSGTWP